MIITHLMQKRFSISQHINEVCIQGSWCDIVAIIQQGQLARYTETERDGNPCMINTINLAGINAITIADCHVHLL